MLHELAAADPRGRFLAIPKKYFLSIFREFWDGCRPCNRVIAPSPAKQI
jgi:hypothetical protein